MSYDKLFFIFAALIAVSLVVCIIKKVTKAIIFTLVIIFIFSFVKAINLGQSPMDVFNSSKNDVTYTKEIYNYSQKIKKSVSNTIAAVENKSLPQIKEENKNLHNYLDKVSKLPHGVELNSFHDNYCSYLQNIVLTSDTLIKGADVSNGILKNTEQAKSNFQKYLDELLKIKAK
ncbi:hypothetical protein [Clostridium magnum]|uniref:Uncharacterized protein n=1 Tax=Clostridium magnum DSM 2767 TaxID=1121326 RepID=A0A162SDH3_9CLOT|nr:hypothetical protein [Clostridium magnum]KZL91094.1 hypothetical protein CLMAG_28520 [Clostridium magnum DSM 2767]SHI18346.1 hypothetical protein SAMN02745944_03013 [Clostridium magnum DSM 2767]